MLAQTSYAGFSPAQVALSNRRMVKTLARLPYRQLHRGLIAASRLEAWGRWPLLTLDASHRVNTALARIDRDGSRFGLTQRVRARHRAAIIYEGMPDLLVLLTGLDKTSFRREALRVVNPDVLTNATADGAGAIVAGFRIGPHAALPYVMGALGHDVSMIVSSLALCRTASSIGAAFAPRSSRDVRFMAADNSLVLSAAQADLAGGRLVCTLMDFPAGEFQKASRVRFLDWEIRAPYGIPYLAAMTERPIIPAIITTHGGPRFKLRFLDPLPVPARRREAILETNQALYSELDRQVRRFPSQWVGWTLLESHMGIDPDAVSNQEIVATS
jgi:hypothetical protein